MAMCFLAADLGIQQNIAIMLNRTEHQKMPINDKEYKENGRKV
jgi:hypothetical protein